TPTKIAARPPRGFGPDLIKRLPSPTDKSRMTSETRNPSVSLKSTFRFPPSPRGATMTDDVLILSGTRTPIGSLNGALASVSAPQLGSICVREALSRADAPPDQVDEVILGNVVSAGVGQNPARQAAIHAGVPVGVGATTVNKVCGSGLKAVMLAAQAVRLGDADLIVAGGMESMSQAPYLLPKARQGYRLGHGELLDAVIHDGLWDVYDQQNMGGFGDRCAAKFNFSRQEQDDFAVRSYTRALAAMDSGVLAAEIVPVETRDRKTTVLVSADEEPQRFNEEKLRSLRPAFGADGTVTAGNASSVNDGAAALTICSRRKCEELGVVPIARIVGSATFSQEPEWFTTAPIGALRKLTAALEWPLDSIDLFEINEAFAVVTMAAERELNLPAKKVNILGGAVSLGHPIGCTGARILITLLTALRHSGGKRGITCLCIGGGEAIALAIELTS
ncbi:MAG: thiolase family protein, partial [Planctomycetales bacterium]